MGGGQEHRESGAAKIHVKSYRIEEGPLGTGMGSAWCGSQCVWGLATNGTRPHPGPPAFTSHLLTTHHPAPSATPTRTHAQAGCPSTTAVLENAHGLARYAQICQVGGQRGVVSTIA